MFDSEGMNRLILCLLEIPNVGTKTTHAFLNVCETVSFDAQIIREALKEIKPKLAEKTSIETIQASMDRAENQLATMQRLGVSVLTGDSIPEKVRTIPDPPVILFAKGDVDVLNKPSIAVIGTRKPTKQGQEIAHFLGKTLAQKGYVVVSGLAEGCDAAGHKGCLEVNGKTVAVLAHGLDRVYPAKNRGLAEEILLKKGCLVSEYQFGVEPKANQFVDRDRLQSALSQGVIIAETGLKSGTLHTVRFAEKQCRPVACWLLPKSNNTIPESQKGNWDLVNSKRAFPLADLEKLEEFLVDITNEQENHSCISQLNLF